jgi:hypothetical protein
MTSLRIDSARLLCCMAAALVLATGSVRAQNLLTNSSVDQDTAGWMLSATDVDRGSLSWSAVDSEGSPSSGSLLVSNTQDNSLDFTTAEQCVPVTAGQEYRLSLEILIPEGQDPLGDTAYNTLFYDGTECDGAYLGNASSPNFATRGEWTVKTRMDIVAPDGARSARVTFGVRKTQNLPGSTSAHFDDVFFGPVDGGGDFPAPDPEGWFTDPAFPDFRFNVQITAGGSSSLGNREPTCLPETVCVSGALPGRVEILLRIIGPRPNGYLWPTLFKASPSRFEVWIEQFSTGTVKYYLLEGASPGSSELPGLFDREGFRP